MSASKIFLDTEFTGLHQATTIISLGMVEENGAIFYAEFNDYDTNQIDDFHKEYVLTHMNKITSSYQNWNGTEQNIFIKGSKKEIIPILIKWLSQFDFIEIWADVLAYDWVLFCELFGGARSELMPKNIFYAPFDLATLFRIKGKIEPTSKYEKDISRFDFVEADRSMQHHALEDAKVELLCYKKLMPI